ncbi:GNAT family N-acetyltransferase [Acholeplasma sp. OttesenSCG-928-E16]|nr:GNAT family N-acetyltransferase [Acholeplasma sp. OttesenSCG-928-E16]
MELRRGRDRILDLKAVFDDATKAEYYFKPMSEDQFRGRVNNKNILDDGIIYCVENDEVIGYGMGYVSDITGHIDSIVVKKAFQNKGVGSLILKELENYFKQNGAKKIRVTSYYTWLIPGYEMHDHPNSPGIRYNSNQYFFFLRNGYNVIGHQDAFHLELKNYEMSDSIQNILEENKKDGYVIELYDAKRHKGFEEFYQAIQNPGFEHSIRYNLGLENPRPFLVVSDKENNVLGWTGAIWNEESGRGHFDGITISPEIRGRGLGKALFSMLAYESKKNGASFMTFYTGLTNHARYIYLGAGFNIAQSFAMMEKVLVK